MKIAIYTPYLDSFGGGERYVLTVAETFSQSHRVDLLLDARQMALGPDKLLSDLGLRMNLDLSRINLKQAPVGKGSDMLSRLLFLKDYDLLFYLTDGSVFYSTAKRNIIHFQVPFKNLSARSLWGRAKLSSWNLAVCNSQFTRGYIQKEWPIKTQVIYPPVGVTAIKPLKKEKMILSVGRFTSFTKSKKHEEMINAFSELSQHKTAQGWSLHLAGSVEGDKTYIDELKNLAGDLPVTFYPDVPFSELVKLYGRTSIYWHAAGLGEEDPAKMEHFGITTVEAMTGGCVPVVINKGGQPEIVEDKVSGFLWNGLGELQSLTLELLDNPKLMTEVAAKAVSRSNFFSKTKFQEQVRFLITSL